MNRPFVKHLLAANNRYGARLGSQFAAAITYFSILSMVPVLMFAISVTGFTLTVLRPELWDAAQEAIRNAVGSGDENDPISEAVGHALSEWRSFGIIAILTLGYTGSNWVGNLKHAFRVMWRDKFSDAAQTKNFILELLENLLIFLGLFVCVILAFGMTVVGAGFTEQVVSWLSLEHIAGISFIVRGVTILLSFLAGWLLFAFIFVALPGESTTRRGFLGGTLAGALTVTVIQQLAGLLANAFSGNAAAVVFGPIIVLMLVFNTLATVILMIAAWVGTARTYEAELERAERAKRTGKTTDVDDDDIDAQPLVAASQEQARIEQGKKERWAATRSYDSLRTENFDPAAVPQPREDVAVSQATAARGMKVASGVGYGLGAATGIGLGAAIAGLLKRKK